MSKLAATQRSRAAHYWPHLEPGDLVDVVAPASSSTPTSLKAALRFVEDFGLVPRVPKDLFSRRELICANTDERRFAHLKAALLSKESKAVWCLRGGYGSNRLLPRLAKLTRPQKSKLVIGYSDITALHNFLNQCWDWPSLHGAMLEGLGNGEGGRRELMDIRKIVFGLEEQIVFKNLMPLNKAARSQKIIKAPVVGGNLTVLMGLFGTSWQIPPKGKILMLEDIGERGYRVDRMLFQMESAGYLKGVRAIIFGDFVGGEEDDGAYLWREVQMTFATQTTVPVLKGLPCGHGIFQRPLPFNTPSILQLGREPSLAVKAGYR